MTISLWRKLDCFLRNRPIPSPTAYARTVPWDPDSLYDNPDPWYTSAYWTVRRGIKYVREFPENTYYAIRWFIQRGIRGWANRDTWSLDYHLNTWMPDALRYMKAHKHGVAFAFFPEGPQYIDEHGNPTDEAFQLATARYDEVMGKIIEGFEAGRRMDDSLYEKEVGPYPCYRPKGVSREAWDKVKDDHFVALRALEARDQALLEEGLALFAKYYQTLND